MTSDDLRTKAIFNLNGAFVRAPWEATTSAGFMEPLLHSSMTPNADLARIVVDYSSMSSAWYAGIVNFLRYATVGHQVAVDFVYTPGVHEKLGTAEGISNFVGDIVTMAGCDGLVVPQKRTAAFFRAWL